MLLERGQREGETEREEREKKGRKAEEGDREEWSELQRDREKEIQGMEWVRGNRGKSAREKKRTKKKEDN